MLYRCRQCQYEEARGCLPTATCGGYALLLLVLSIASLFGLLRLTMWLVGPSPAPAGPPVESEPFPWWAYPAIISGSIALAIGGAWFINYVLEFAEWLRYARRRCPTCGARRWSWGFTRGFGL